MADKRLTRRQLLTKLAATGAAAWAAPVMTSLPATASSSFNPCRGLFCDCSQVPFDFPSCCGGRGYCWNRVDKRGRWRRDRCGCGNTEGDSSCSSFLTCTKGGKDTECPKGYGCFSTCCDQSFSLPYVCIKKCHTFATGPRRPIPRPPPGVPTVFGRG